MCGPSPPLNPPLVRLLSPSDLSLARWLSWQVLLFHDSFEHEVWNLTASPRLVLIVDLWHPMLTSDEQRLAALQNDDEREVYLGVARRGTYRNTSLRGH